MLFERTTVEILLPHLSTANAIAGIYEYLLKKSTNKDIDVSRLFIYYNARKIDKEIDNLPPFLTDEGATVTSTIDALKETGTCLESNWPYVKAIVSLRPSRKNYKEAKNATIATAMQIPVDRYKMKLCLAQGFPFLFGLQLYASFDKAADNGGVVPMPKSSMAARAAHGNHAMLAVGYSEASQAFIVRNSWGEEWGDKGYCYIPYEYMTNKDLTYDLWSVKQNSGDTLGTDHWVMKDTINYLAHNSALGPKAYTDDDEGLSIEEIVVRDRVSSNFPKGDGGPSNANYPAPPIAYYPAPPIPNYPAPLMANYAAPPIASYPAPLFANYPMPPFINYPAPPFVDNFMPPFINNPMSPFINYPAPPFADNLMPPFINNPVPSFINYPAPPFVNYGGINPMANLGRAYGGHHHPIHGRYHRPPLYPPRPACVNKPPGLLRRIFLKP